MGAAAAGRDEALISAGRSRRRMSCTAGLLENVARSVESQLRPQLGGLFGGMIRAYLPQTWVFRTEEGAASLVVDRDGHASVAAEAKPTPDVSVEALHAELKAVLSRERPGPPPPSLRVTPHTAKGRTAFDYLRGRFGL
jgi:hypothetical protein